MVGVDYAELGVSAHPAAADEVCVTVNREHILCLGGLEDAVQSARGECNVPAVVLAP